MRFKILAALVAFVTLPTLASATTITGTINDTITINVKAPIVSGDQVWCMLEINGAGPNEIATAQATIVSGTTYKCNPVIHYEWTVGSVPPEVSGSFTVYLVNPNTTSVALAALRLNVPRSTMQPVGPFATPKSGSSKSLSTSTEL